MNRKGFHSLQELIHNLNTYLPAIELIAEKVLDKTRQGYIDHAIEYYSDKGNYDKLVRQNEDGELNIIKDSTSRIYQKTNIKLLYEHLKGQIAFEIKFDGKKNQIVKNLPYADNYQFDTALMLVHDDLGNIGIIRLKDAKHKLPTGIHDGVSKKHARFRNDHKGVVISDSTGYLLWSNVKLITNLQQGGIRLGFNEMTDLHVATQIKKAFQERDISYWGADGKQDFKVYHGSYMRSVTYLAGDSLIPVLQSLSTEVLPLGLDESVFKESRILKSESVVVLRDRSLISKLAKERLAAFLFIIDQISGEYSHNLFKHDKRLFITEEFLNLHEDLNSNKYSFKGFKAIIKDISNVMGSSIDVSRGLARVYMDGNERVLKTRLSKEDFYKNWLNVIQTFIATGNSKYFNGYFHLSIKNFQGDFNDESNHGLIKEIDKALIDLFGYPTFILLASGMVSFSNENGLDFHLFFRSSSKNVINLGELSKEWNIRPIHERNFDTISSVGLTGLFDQKTGLTPTLHKFASLLLFGYYHQFNNKEKVGFETARLGSGFIEHYYEHFTISEPSRKYEEALYKKIVSEFLIREYSNEYLASRNIDERNTYERGEILKFLFPFVKYSVSRQFDISISSCLKELKRKFKDIIDFTSDKWKEQLEYWESLTLKQAMAYLAKYIDKPTRDEDIVRELVAHAHQRKDWLIGGITSTAKGIVEGIYHRELINNPIFAEGLKVYISGDLLLNKMVEWWFTGRFFVRATDDTKNPRKQNYQLRLSSVFQSKEFCGKILNDFNRYISLFYDEHGNLKEGLRQYLESMPVDGKWSVKFYKTTGSGPVDRSDFSVDRFDFDPRNKKEVGFAIAKVLFYQLFFQKTFTNIITDNQKVFLYSDIDGIYYKDQLDFRRSISEKIEYGESFWTDENGFYTQDILKEISSKPMALCLEDLRYFSYFSPPEGMEISTVDYFSKKIQEILFRHSLFQELSEEQGNNFDLPEHIELELERHLGINYQKYKKFGRIIIENN